MLLFESPTFQAWRGMKLRDQHIPGKANLQRVLSSSQSSSERSLYRLCSTLIGGGLRLTDCWFTTLLPNVLNGTRPIIVCDTDQAPHHSLDVVRSFGLLYVAKYVHGAQSKYSAQMIVF